MTDIKKIISSLIENEININVYDYIKEIDDPTKGDYAFPCFSLSKEMHKSPVDIANELVEKIKDERIEKIESINGYLNFFINKEYLAKLVLEEYDSNKEGYGTEKHDEHDIRDETWSGKTNQRKELSKPVKPAVLFHRASDTQWNRNP